MADVETEEQHLYEIASRMIDRVPEEAPAEYELYRQAFDGFRDALSAARENASKDEWNNILPPLIKYGAIAGGALISAHLLLSVWLTLLGMLPIVGAFALLVAALAKAHLHGRRTIFGQRILFAITGNRHRKLYVLQRQRLLNTIVERDLVIPTVRLALNECHKDKLSRKFAVQESPGLGDLHSSLYYVPTSIKSEAGELIHQFRGGSIGIAGPRGSGKSSLLRLYCDARNRVDSPDICCMVSAPVDYVAREFVLHVFAALCRSVVVKYARRGPGKPSPPQRLIAFTFAVLVHVVLGAVPGSLVWFGIHSYSASPLSQVLSVAATLVGGSTLLWVYGILAVIYLRRRPALRRQRRLQKSAKRNLAKIRYLQTHNASWSGSLKAGLGVKLSMGFDRQRSRGLSRAEQPMGYPEIVRLFRVFAGMASAHVSEQGGRVLIGIDELDKIASADQAEKFLNEIKSIFGVPQVYFLITVSDDALTAFERRGMRLRDAFDSSFDEIIRVELLTYAESRRMLYRRVIGLSEPYVALCHALSGGLARDLIRSARHVIRAAGPRDKPREFGEIAKRVIREDVHRKARSLGHAEAIRNDAGLLYVLHKARLGHYDQKTLSDLLHDVQSTQPEDNERNASEADLLRREFMAFLYLSHTLEDVFNEHLDENRVAFAADGSRGQCVFDMMASARVALGTNTTLAWRLTSETRQTWGLEVWNGQVG